MSVGITSHKPTSLLLIAAGPTRSQQLHGGRNSSSVQVRTCQGLPMASVYNFLARRNCNDPQRTAGTAHDLQRRRDHDSSRRRKLVQITKTGQAKLTAAVHKVVVRKR